MFHRLFTRLIATVPVIGMVAVIVFLMVRMGSGDPAVLVAGDGASPETVAAIRTQLGLDRPIWEQFAVWVAKLAQGDFGVSVFSRQPVLHLIGQRIEPTLALAIATLVVSVTIAIPLGVMAAARRGTWIDRAIMSLSVAGISIPVFVMAYLLIYVFSMQLGWFPVQGYRPIAEGWGEFARHLAMPTLALSSAYIALFARITRSAMLEVQGEDFIRTAYAKGLSRPRILIVHALRNAAVPIISVVGTGFALMVGGVVVTETVFNIPGMGRLVVDAVLARDFAVVQGVILILGLIYVLINFLTDMAYLLLDPRIRY